MSIPRLEDPLLKLLAVISITEVASATGAFKKNKDIKPMTAKVITTNVTNKPSKASFVWLGLAGKIDLSKIFILNSQ